MNNRSDSTLGNVNVKKKKMRGIQYLNFPQGFIFQRMSHSCLICYVIYKARQNA